MPRKDKGKEKPSIISKKVQRAFRLNIYEASRLQYQIGLIEREHKYQDRIKAQREKASSFDESCIVRQSSRVRRDGWLGVKDEMSLTDMFIPKPCTKELRRSAKIAGVKSNRELTVLGVSPESASLDATPDNELQMDSKTSRTQSKNVKFDLEHHQRPHTSCGIDGKTESPAVERPMSVAATEVCEQEVARSVVSLWKSRSKMKKPSEGPSPGENSDIKEGGDRVAKCSSELKVDSSPAKAENDIHNTMNKFPRTKSAPQLASIVQEFVQAKRDPRSDRNPFRAVVEMRRRRRSGGNQDNTKPLTRVEKQLKEHKQTIPALDERVEEFAKEYPIRYNCVNLPRITKIIT